MTAPRTLKVLVTNPKLPEAGLRLLRERYELIFCDSIPPTKEDILRKCRGVDGIVWINHYRLDAEILDAAGPQLRVISTNSAGLDFVDIPEFKKRGVPLGYTPFVLSDAVADLAVGLMISASRRFHEGYLKIVNSAWEQHPQWMLGQDIKASTVGIVGLGRIGQAICKRLKGFDVGKFVYSGHGEKPEGKELGAEFVSFDKLLQESDHVFIACSLTDETRGMFNKVAFEKMKSTSVLVNIARGPIVVQDDLVKALKQGTIFSAALDVMVPEPLPSDDPLVSTPNCVIIPHLGSATQKVRDEMSIISAQNVINGIENKPLVYSAY